MAFKNLDSVNSDCVIVLQCINLLGIGIDFEQIILHPFDNASYKTKEKLSNKLGIITYFDFDRTSSFEFVEGSIQFNLLLLGLFGENTCILINLESFVI